MARGTIKWFHPVMGYGFIAPDDGSASVLVPALTSQRDRVGRLRKGARVEYDTVPGRDGRLAAANLRLTDDDLPRSPPFATGSAPVLPKLTRSA